ncbi:hypothetical protein B0I72DRAFT_140526 [Yarrowia lipolytica]|jgi:hypothetical protein|uniref:Uncharacterized protein n=1 Tax=Yarrowia lipolytica TaxID=4952 RepID=A0A371CDU4_YARLL|nr:Hypothetical protein YALI2_C00287g [Yarrowia lipolytica]RDW28455.1 hypothetical protein B0I71DRAFT_127343 [Yarrowia lipolytica]RDW31020.1 hypothetical protein B0I72DRAFT_140526 [Yarrowia lipolytica]RDW40256.1 hypothetical protein B0I73DRAFT_130586 [Yarrowia lipolytica]RDW45091.1 hypothetical protein B0I74DRAFT_139361 [Yarrowia lipolytica]
MGRGIERKDFAIDWILEHYCERYLIRPDEKSLRGLRPLVEQHLRSIGGYHKAGINVLRFCLITRNLLSADRSTRFQGYINDIDAILKGMALQLEYWLDAAPHLAVSDPDKIMATVRAESRSIMVLVARECFFVTVDRDAFSTDDLEQLKAQYKEHRQWYDEDDTKHFGMYLDLLSESGNESAHQLVRTANVISHSLQEAAQNDRPVWRRLSEFTDYLTGHIRAIRCSFTVYRQHAAEGMKPGMSALAIASRLSVLKEERRRERKLEKLEKMKEKKSNGNGNGKKKL